VTAAPTSGDGAASSREIPRLERGTIVRAVVIAVLLVVALVGVPAVATADWVTTATSVAIYAVVALGFGILYGRVGLISLEIGRASCRERV